MKRLTPADLAIATVVTVLFVAALGVEQAFAHKAPHTNEQLAAFEQVFMEEVRTGDLLFHGDPATEKKLGVKLSSTGMACAMCHPYTSDTHPQEFPKFQEQMNEFATLRDMINWCIENPVKGKPLADDDPRLRALEAFILAQRKGAALDYGKH